MKKLKKQNYSQPILVKHLSLRDLTARCSYSNHNHGKPNFSNIMRFILHLLHRH